MRASVLCLDRGDVRNLGAVEFQCVIEAEAVGGDRHLPLSAPELEGHSGAYLSDCGEVSPTADARDDALAEKVWELSTKWVEARA